MKAETKERIEKEITLYAIASGAGFSILMAVTTIVAYLNNWRILWDFNHYGEGMIELFILPASAGMSVLALLLTFKNLRKTKL